MGKQANEVVGVGEAGGVLKLAPQHARVLRSFSQDTGAFRLTNEQAANLAAACAAALELAEAIAATGGKS
jgi:hypothetical protein